jgi:hypothetical protein
MVTVRSPRGRGRPVRGGRAVGPGALPAGRAAAGPGADGADDHSPEQHPHEEGQGREQPHRTPWSRSRVAGGHGGRALGAILPACRTGLRHPVTSWRRRGTSPGSTVASLQQCRHRSGTAHRGPHQRPPTPEVADVDDRRSRPRDDLVLLWVVAWLVVGAWSGYLVWQLTELSASAVASGRSLGVAAEALQNLGSVPVVGDASADFGRRIAGRRRGHRPCGAAGRPQYAQPRRARRAGRRARPVGTRAPLLPPGPRRPRGAGPEEGPLAVTSLDSPPPARDGGDRSLRTTPARAATSTRRVRLRAAGPPATPVQWPADGGGRRRVGGRHDPAHDLCARLRRGRRPVGQHHPPRQPRSAGRGPVGAGVRVPALQPHRSRATRSRGHVAVRAGGVGARGRLGEPGAAGVPPARRPASHQRRPCRAWRA